MRLVIDNAIWAAVRKVPDIDALADRVGIQYGLLEETIVSGNPKNPSTLKQHPRIVLFREHARINLDGEQLMIVRRSDIIGEYLPEKEK